MGFQSARTSEMLLGDTLLPTVIREFQFTRGREMQLNPIVEGMWIGVSIHSHMRDVTVHLPREHLPLQVSIHSRVRDVTIWRL